jgi:hypothetical protein
MDPSDITDALKRNGFVFTDLETPGGTVRVTARGPHPDGNTDGRRVRAADGGPRRAPDSCPGDPENDGQSEIVVKAQHEGVLLERFTCRTRGAGARRYVDLARKYGG